MIPGALLGLLVSLPHQEGRGVVDEGEHRGRGALHGLGNHVGRGDLSIEELSTRFMNIYLMINGIYEQIFIEPIKKISSPQMERNP